MFNYDLVFDNLITGENYVKEINLHKDMFAKFFLFLRAMQAVIDTSFILIVNLNLKKPKNYFEIFTILKEGNIITEATEKRMRAFSALRSKLIFNLTNSNEDEVNSVITEFDSAFTNFNDEVRKFIKNINLNK